MTTPTPASALLPGDASEVLAGAPGTANPPGGIAPPTTARVSSAIASAASGRADRRTGRGWPRLISPVVILLLWQAASTAGVLPAQKLPSPVTIAATAVRLVRTSSPAYGTLQGAMLVSLQRVAIGFLFGATAGVLLALLAGLSRLGENAVDPVMQMLRTLPLFGLIPVFIVWFGIGEIPKVTLVAMGVIFPLYLNTFAGIRGVDGKLAEVGRVLGLRRAEVVRHLVLPGALPQVLVGVRQSLGVAWIALVVAEQINADAGLGFMISQAQQFLQIDVIVVALLVYCGLGLLTDALVRLIERRALAWRRGFMG